MFVVGSLVTAAWTPGGTGAATLSVLLPDGTTLTPAPTVAATASPYAATFTATQPGRHLLTWTRGTQIVPDVIDVWPTDPRYLVSLADAMAQIGGSSKDVTEDSVAIYVASATYMIEKLAGPVLTNARTYVTDGDRDSINLPAAPVTVSSVTVNGVLQDPSKYTVDTNAGIIYGPFAAGMPLNVTIAYTVGSPVVSPLLQMATLELVRHLWQSSKQVRNGGLTAVASGTVMTPYGFAVPNRVHEMCEVVPRAPGFA